MKRILLRSLAMVLLVAMGAGAYVGWRTYGVYQAAHGGFQHLRYLLESGETIGGQPAEDVLSDNYLRSLFGDNPELVERLKTVVDLGMATDANLKLGFVSAMIVTHRTGPNNEIMDAAIYAVGGFPDPNSKRLGFHSTGYFEMKVDSELWFTGNSIMNLLGRDVIVFCEQEKAEAHMSLLFELLNGAILPLAERVVEAPLHYAIVFPDPKDLAPPHLRNGLQTVIIKGQMDGDAGKTEIMLVSPNPRSAAQVQTVVKDMATLARITFHDKFGGYVKEMNFGAMNDTWWSVEYVKLVDTLQIVRDQVIVVARVEYDRVQNNAILKTVERAGRDIAMQKAFTLSGDLPWEFVYRDKENPSGGYWSTPHRWGPDWPLGDEGVPTPGSIAAAKERDRLRAEKEAMANASKEEAERNRLEQERLNPSPASPSPLPAQST